MGPRSFLAALLPVAFALPACSMVFDDSYPVLDDDPVDEVLEPPAADPGGMDPGDPEPAFFAGAERSNRGTITQGSFIDSHHLDGEVESVESETDRGKQKIDHRWLFADVPADKFLVLELVGQFTTLQGTSSGVELDVKFAPYGEKSVDLPQLIATDGQVSYTAVLPPLSSTSFELQMKLDVDVENSWVLDIDYMKASELELPPPGSSPSGGRRDLGHQDEFFEP
jgi:hypothetical protein